MNVLDKTKDSDRERDLLARFSLKEGNQRLEKNRKYLDELQAENLSNRIPKLTNVQSPVIMDTFEEYPVPFQSIKNNVQYASGHKFNSSSNKIILVKNLRRNGDLNEGIKEATSSDSRIGISPRPKENHDTVSSEICEEAKINNTEDSYERKLQNEDLARKLRMKLNFNELKNSFEQEIKLSSNIYCKIKPLANLESLRQSSPPNISSSRQNTERKEEFESQILEIVAQIRNSFNVHHKAPETKTYFYKIGRVLGKGAFGKVNLAMHVLAKRLGKLNLPNSCLIIL